MWNERRILVIDDDAETVLLLSVVLKNQGYRILTAPNASEGFALASREQPDLIILDVYMPTTNGLDLLPQLRRTNATKNIPVLMLTAAEHMATADMAFHLGANAYLTKPIKSPRLQHKIKELLHQEAG